MNIRHLAMSGNRIAVVVGAKAGNRFVDSLRGYALNFQDGLLKRTGSSRNLSGILLNKQKLNGYFVPHSIFNNGGVI